MMLSAMSAKAAPQIAPAASVRNRSNKASIAQSPDWSLRPREDHETFKDAKRAPLDLAHSVRNARCRARFPLGKNFFHSLGALRP
jgi:hypothetical protein